MRQPTCINTSENELAVIREELNELRQTRQELNELRQAFAALSSNVNGHHDSKSIPALETTEAAVTDRRGMLKKVGTLAAGIAAASFLRPANASAAARSSGNSGGKEGSTGPDVTGDPVVLGQSNSATGTDRTSIFHSLASGSDLSPTVFRVDNYHSTSLVDPPGGDHTTILAHINNNGASTTTGHFYAIFAVAETPDGGGATGVYGEGDNIGVEGIGGPGGWGVIGRCDGSIFSRGIEGLSDMGVGGSFGGGRAAIGLSEDAGALANPNVSPPSGASAGDLYRGHAAPGLLGAGSLWYCVASGANQYRRLADATTTGALTLKAPQRLVDTRNGSGFAGAGSHLGSDTLQTYNIATLAALPTGARGMVGRITIVNATNSGGLQESPNGPPGAGNDLGFGTAVVNYPPASTIPAFGVPLISALDSSGNIRVHSIMASGTADVIIDITGFYV